MEQNKITGKEIFERIADINGLSESVGDDLYRTFMDQIEYELFQGNTIVFRCLLDMNLIKPKRTEIYNTTLKCKIPVQKKRTVKVNISRAFQKKLNLFDNNNNIGKK